MSLFIIPFFLSLPASFKVLWMVLNGFFFFSLNTFEVEVLRAVSAEPAGEE